MGSLLLRLACATSAALVAVRSAPAQEGPRLARDLIEAHGAGEDPRATYVLAHRLLEEVPAHLEGRRIAARLALEMRSPALALEHVSFALARMGDGQDEAPMRRLAAVAHAALGEPAAAWNCIEDIVAGSDDAAFLREWQARLLGDFLRDDMLAEIEARGAGDLERRTACTVAELWRAALVDPEGVGAELDRRLADGIADSTFEDALLLRATLWVGRLRTAGRAPEALEELHRFTAWLERADRIQATETLAAVLRVQVDALPSLDPAAGGDGPPWLTEEEPEIPVLEDPLGALRAEIERLRTAAEGCAGANVDLTLALGGPTPARGPLLDAIARAEQQRSACAAAREAADLVKFASFDVAPASRDEAEELRQLFDRTVAEVVVPSEEFLERLLDGVPERVLGLHRVARTRRLLGEVNAGETSSENVVAITDEIIAHGGAGPGLDARHWSARIAALQELDPNGASHGHAVARAAGDHGAADALRILEDRAAVAGAAATAARSAWDEGALSEAFAALGRALELQPMNAGLLLERARWLSEVLGAEDDGAAWVAWWRVASPLGTFPDEALEALYRAGQWEALLSVSETALEDWPLSSKGFVFHELAAVALDLEDAAERARPALARSERGPDAATTSDVLRALALPRRTRGPFLVSYPTDARFTPAALDGALAAHRLHASSLAREVPLPYTIESARREANPDALRAAFEGGADAGALLRGSDDPRAVFFAAAAAASVEDRDEAQRLWLRAAGETALPAPLRVHAAREVRRLEGRRFVPLRGRDAAYVPGGATVDVTGGRQIVSSGTVDVRSSDGGAVRFLGVGSSADAAVAFDGEDTPLIVVEDAAARARRGSTRVDGAWIVRGGALGYSGSIRGPVDAVSCAVSSWLRLHGGGTARFVDLAFQGTGSLEVARPVSIENLVADAALSSIRVVEGGDLRIDGAVVDASERRKTTPWLREDGGAVSHERVSVVGGEADSVSVVGPGALQHSVAATGGEVLEAADAVELGQALRKAKDGDTIRLTGDTYDPGGTLVARTSVHIVGSGRTRLALGPRENGRFRVEGGARVTLTGVELRTSPRGYQPGQRTIPSSLFVEGGSLVVFEESTLAAQDRTTATVFCEARGLAILRGGTLAARLHAERGAVVLLDGPFVDGGRVEGDGTIGVLELGPTRAGAAVDIVGSSLRTAAGPGEVHGVRAGSTAARLAAACRDLRWREAEEDFDAAIVEARTSEARSAAITSLAAELEAAGRVAGSARAQIDERLLDRLVPLLEAHPQEAPELVLDLPPGTHVGRKVMDRLRPDVREIVGTYANLALRDPVHRDDRRYLSLATRYELAYPLSHPDRAPAMRCLDQRLPIEEAPAAIEEIRREERRLAELRRRAEMAAAQAAAAAREVAARERIRRDRERMRWERQAAVPRAAWKPSTQSYIAAPTSYGEAYRSNQAFYNKLNSFAGGGSYVVSASGVSYR